MVTKPRLAVFAGTRPQLIKCAALFAAWNEGYKTTLELLLVHTGQHYDQNMSGVFLAELGLPAPVVEFRPKRESSLHQLASMMVACADWLKEAKVEASLVLGDTNTTLAAALASLRVGIPIAHVESGLRSGDFFMPEEQNRILTDRLSKWLFVPSAMERMQLAKEGVPEQSGNLSPEVVEAGDLMADLCLQWKRKTLNRTHALGQLGLKENNYLLATVHRDFNTDYSDRLESVLRYLDACAKAMDLPMWLFLHPRTRSKMKAFGLDSNNYQGLRFEEPLGYGAMQHVLAGCRALFTDSGGMQKEGAWHEKPVVVLRASTEWKQLFQHGLCWLAGDGLEDITPAVEFVLEFESKGFPEFYGNGAAGNVILSKLVESLRPEKNGVRGIA